MPPIATAVSAATMKAVSTVAMPASSLTRLNCGNGLPRDDESGQQR
jgi:hypothetical protein